MEGMEKTGHALKLKTVCFFSHWGKKTPLFETLQQGDKRRAYLAAGGAVGKDGLSGSPVLGLSTCPKALGSGCWSGCCGSEATLQEAALLTGLPPGARSPWSRRRHVSC